MKRDATEIEPEREEAASEVQRQNTSTSQTSTHSDAVDHQSAHKLLTKEAESVVESKPPYPSAERRKPPKRKRSPSRSGSSALTRSVSQGKLRTYGKKSHDTSEEPLKDDHPPALFIRLGAKSRAHQAVQPRGHTPQTSDPQTYTKDEDTPMFHGHGKSNKNKQATQLRRQLRQRGQEALATKLKASESPHDVKSPKKPSVNTSVPPQQSSLTASSSTTSPTSPLSSTSPAESRLSHQSLSGKSGSHRSSPPPFSASQTTSTPRQSFTSKSISTRSHCRYRTISLPREQNGSRVRFCVPQCSLYNTELMMKLQVTDDGPATQRDYDKLIEHVETLDFDPLLIGVLRLLVGVDLLRENEIYYLPQEGEEVMRKTTKGMLHKTIKDSPDKKSVPNSPQSNSVAGSSSKSVAPTSYAESTSTTSSSLRHESNRSMTDDEDSDDSHAKRRKWAHKAEVGDNDSTTSTTASPTQARKAQRTLKKGLSHDAQNYEPEVEHENADQSIEKNIPKIRRRKSTRHGLKRRRTEGDTMRDDSGSSPLKGSASRSKRAKVMREDTQHDNS
jgi:hypothetical protein